MIDKIDIVDIVKKAIHILQVLLGLVIIVFPTSIHPVLISVLGLFYVVYWVKKLLP